MNVKMAKVDVDSFVYTDPNAPIAHSTVDKEFTENGGYHMATSGGYTDKSKLVISRTINEKHEQKMRKTVQADNTGSPSSYIHLGPDLVELRPVPKPRPTLKPTRRRDSEEEFSLIKKGKELGRGEFGVVFEGASHHHINNMRRHRDEYIQTFTIYLTLQSMIHRSSSFG